MPTTRRLKFFPHEAPRHLGTPDVGSWAGAQFINEEVEAKRNRHENVMDRARPPIMTTITTSTPQGVVSSPSAAMVQGLKTEYVLGTAAALRQRMREGDCLGRETVSPTRRVNVGTLQSLMRGRWGISGIVH